MAPIPSPTASPAAERQTPVILNLGPLYSYLSEGAASGRIKIIFHVWYVLQNIYIFFLILTLDKYYKFKKL